LHKGKIKRVYGCTGGGEEALLSRILKREEGEKTSSSLAKGKRKAFFPTRREEKVRAGVQIFPTPFSQRGEGWINIDSRHRKEEKKKVFIGRRGGKGGGKSRSIK